MSSQISASSAALRGASKTTRTHNTCSTASRAYHRNRPAVSGMLFAARIGSVRTLWTNWCLERGFHFTSLIRIVSAQYDISAGLIQWASKLTRHYSRVSFQP